MLSVSQLIQKMKGYGYMYCPDLAIFDEIIFRDMDDHEIIFYNWNDVSQLVSLLAVS